MLNTTMKNIKNFTPRNIDGTEIKKSENMAKEIGNVLYFPSKDIGVCALARKIYEEKDFEPTPELIEAIKGSELFGWVKEQLVSYLEEK